MTSNAGAAELNRRLIGFEGKSNTGAISKEIERVFAPEFRNRLDGVVLFKPVDDSMAFRIAQKAFNALAEKLKAKNVELAATPALLGLIAKKGTSEQFGAREIIRVVDTEIKKPLINEVLFGRLAQGGKALADEVGGEAVIAITEAPKAETREVECGPGVDQ
jgi:ATP-dependent Clp protease ATP-binding subunit ClpA